MALARQLGPALDPSAAKTFAYYDELRRKRRPTREEKRQMAAFRELSARSSEEIHARSRAMKAEAGADELLPAVQAGLVQIDPVLSEADPLSLVASSVAKAAGVEAVYDSLIAESFMNRVQDLLADPFAFRFSTRWSGTS